MILELDNRHTVQLLGSLEVMEYEMMGHQRTLGLGWAGGALDRQLESHRFVMARAEAAFFGTASAMKGRWDRHLRQLEALESTNSKDPARV